MAQLIALAVGIGPGIEETQYALGAVLGRKDQRGKRQRQHRSQPEKYFQVESAQPQRAHGDDTDHHERTHVRLQQ